MNIPEIQDLNVAPWIIAGRDIATRLWLRPAKPRRARKGCDTIGLGVGLVPPLTARRSVCMAKLGYLPDGAGLVHDAESGRPTARSKPNDDDLCLMLIKTL